MSYEIFQVEYQRRLDSLTDYAMENLVPRLSKAVLAHGKETRDERSLLDLARWSRSDPYNRGLTKVWQLHANINMRCTFQAQCQIKKINNANYPYPEIISMMLEQCDYWVQDTPVIIEWAIAYLDGKFDEGEKP